MDIKKTLRWLICGACSVCILLFITIVSIEKYLSRRIVYKKPDFIVSERKKMIEQYGAQPIAVSTPDNKKIAALYVERPAAKRIFLICHGFKRSKEYMTGFLNIFPHDSLFFIDFRGHGQSEGDRVSLGLHEHIDVIAAARYIKNLLSPALPLYAIGISMGGSAVLRAAADGAPFDAVISDSAPSSFKDTVVYILQKRYNIPAVLGWSTLTWYEWLMGASLAQSCYTTYASKITCPVLLIHDKNDHLIDYKHACNIFDALGSHCKLLYTPIGSRHGKMHLQQPENYKKVVEYFIKQCART